eukprot:6207819-Pleurochrysis_carterae.AAC.2
MRLLSVQTCSAIPPLSRYPIEVCIRFSYIPHIPRDYTDFSPRLLSQPNQLPFTSSPRHSQTESDSLPPSAGGRGHRRCRRDKPGHTPKHKYPNRHRADEVPQPPLATYSVAYRAALELLLKREQLARDVCAQRARLRQEAAREPMRLRKSMLTQRVVRRVDTAAHGGGSRSQSRS